MQSKLDMAARRNIAEELFGRIEWKSGEMGYCVCPGASFHTTRAGRRDCRVCIDSGRPPTVHCMHTSCSPTIAAANQRLRSLIGSAEFVSPAKSPATYRDTSGPSDAAQTPLAPKRKVRPVRTIREYKLDWRKVYGP